MPPRIDRARNIEATDIDDAWLGFLGRLRRKGFPRSFIDRHAEDLFGQAQLELFRALDKGAAIHTPTAWLIHCAWRRTQSLLDKQSRAPVSISVDGTIPLRSESPDPEEELLACELHNRLRAGIRCLSGAEREIVELVYFKEMSCRAAGRALGWEKSKADRRHRSALKRLRSLLEKRDEEPHR
jgi:RNA polymerase sigma factor (sigma-70 family)